MIKYTLVMVAMFLVVATLLAALIVAATNVTDAYADAPCAAGGIDPTTGQPCPPRGGSFNGTCMEGAKGHMFAGVGDYVTILLAPLVAIGALVVTERRHDGDDRE